MTSTVTRERPVVTAYVVTFTLEEAEALKAYIGGTTSAKPRALSDLYWCLVDSDSKLPTDANEE